jgi:cold shock CspA family protein
MEMKGELVNWNEEQAQGVIHSSQLAGDILIELSTLKAMSRKPQVGDVIHFHAEEDNQGRKIVEVARIEGVEVKKMTYVKPQIMPEHEQSSKKKSAIPPVNLNTILIALILILFALRFYMMGPE